MAEVFIECECGHVYRTENATIEVTLKQNGKTKLHVRRDYYSADGIPECPACALEKSANRDLGRAEIMRMSE